MTGKVYLQRYQAVELLGEGGMGQVFLGMDLESRREVVIKVMHDRFANDQKFRRAFRREMVLMKRFRHPYAVHLYDAALEDTDQPAIVMEYVRGETLSHLIEKQGRLPAFQMGKVLGQLCQVLQAAHDNGIIHRDLTPVNVMVMNPATPQEQVKVMDFGLARMGAGPYIPLEKLTGDGQDIGGGTPDYVSPEQVRREEVDYRADLYSLGVLLFKALTGYLPFENAETIDEILQAHVDTPPPPFRQYGLNGSVPEGVENLVHACLAKYPDKRPQSALEVARLFGEAMGLKLIVGDPITATLLPGPDEIERIDPRTVMDHFESWMPEPIAVVKLRGFAHDVGGEIIDSEPGLIRVSLPDPLVVEEAPQRGFLSLIGFGKKNAAPTPQITLELRLEKLPERQNVLMISVVVIPGADRARLNDQAWHDWCQDLCRELRAYMISC